MPPPVPFNTLDMAPIIDRIVFASGSVVVGAFRCPPSHPLFRDSGPIRNDIFVFPRRAVRLCQGSRPFVADPGLVTFYNRGQRYVRSPLGGPDESDWFAVEHGILVDAVRHLDPSVDDRPERPFRFEHGPGDPRVYLGQRRLFASLLGGRRLADPLRIEETVVGLLGDVLERAHGFWGRPRRARAPAARQRDTVEHAKALLAERLADPVGLAYFARETATSVFQLCKLFRAVTGSTLHAYRNRLRMHDSLERLAGAEPILDIALGLGYSSHSHFSAAFRRLFGVTPSSLRHELA